MQKRWWMFAAAAAAALGVSTIFVVMPPRVSANDDRPADCRGLPTAHQLKQLLAAAPATGGDAGGLFHGERMWGAVVNRSGEICAFTTSTDNPTQVWPGSQAIAKAKAFTANAFSLDALALSTARLYTFTQPGHSLNSLGQSNLWNPEFTAPPSGSGGGRHEIAGGMIFFGGGVALYRGGAIIGGSVSAATRRAPTMRLPSAFARRRPSTRRAARRSTTSPTRRPTVPACSRTRSASIPGETASSSGTNNRRPATERFTARAGGIRVCPPPREP